MNRVMIKLMATDVDGTLVKEGSPEVSDAVIEEIQRLEDIGIHVVIASGRQYGSLHKLFARANRKLSYIAENGAHIIVDDENLHLVKMERKYVEQLMEDLRALYKEDCHVVASTSKGCFLESKSEEFIHLIRDSYRNEVKLTDDLLKEDVEFIKLAIYKKGSIKELGENYLIPKWKDKVKACMAGAEWVDFMDHSVDKGNGLAILLNHLGFTKDEVMVFGDNENDIGLMKAAKHSYAVENAMDCVKEAAAHICPPYWEDGVLQVLRTLE